MLSCALHHHNTKETFLFCNYPLKSFLIVQVHRGYLCLLITMFDFHNFSLLNSIGDLFCCICSSTPKIHLLVLKLVWELEFKHQELMLLHLVHYSSSQVPSSSLIRRH